MAYEKLADALKKAVQVCDKALRDFEFARTRGLTDDKSDIDRYAIRYHSILRDLRSDLWTAQDWLIVGSRLCEPSEREFCAYLESKPRTLPKY